MKEKLTNVRNSKTFISEYEGAPSGKYPINSLAFNGSDFKSILFIKMSPLSGSRKPVSIFIVVDFPAPFGPRKPTTSPLCTLKLILSTATNSPNDFFKFFASTSFEDND